MNNDNNIGPTKQDLENLRQGLISGVINLADYKTEESPKLPIEGSDQTESLGKAFIRGAHTTSPFLSKSNVENSRNGFVNAFVLASITVLAGIVFFFMAL